MLKTDGRATVIGNENVYTNPDYREGIERHWTNWTHLLTVGDEIYLDEPYYPKGHPSTTNDADQLERCVGVAQSIGVV